MSDSPYHTSLKPMKLMKPTKHLVPLLTTLALSLSQVSALRADDITDQIDTARGAYERGEFQASIQGLQFVIAAIQERVNASLVKLLPEALAGWSAEEPEVVSGGVATMIVGTQLSRKYHRPDDVSLEIKFTANSPFMPMMTMMFSNPMLLQSEPNTRIYTHAGRRGILKEDPAAKQVEISLMGEGNLLIQIEGTGITKADAEAYLKALDLAAVEKAFAVK